MGGGGGGGRDLPSSSPAPPVWLFTMDITYIVGTIIITITIYYYVCAYCNVTACTIHTALRY